jgi:hypothetical protein
MHVWLEQNCASLAWPYDRGPSTAPCWRRVTHSSDSSSVDRPITPLETSGFGSNPEAAKTAAALPPGSNRRSEVASAER